MVCIREDKVSVYLINFLTSEYGPTGQSKQTITAEMIRKSLMVVEQVIQIGVTIKMCQT